MSFPARPARRPYDDPDNAREMARDASACRSQSHLAGAAHWAPGPRRTAGVERRQSSHRSPRSPLQVSEATASFAARLLD